jgi:CheY-like chemotaxis protein
VDMRLRSKSTSRGRRSDAALVRVAASLALHSQATVPDVIVVASALPDMTGLEAVRALGDQNGCCNMIKLEGDCIT